MNDALLKTEIDALRLGDGPVLLRQFGVGIIIAMIFQR